MAERIDAPGDPRVADYAHVGDAAWLRERGLFVVEGRLVLERLIQTGRFSLRSILLTNASLDALAGPLAAVRSPVYLVTREVMETLTGFDFHRGCLALAAREPADSAAARPGRAQRLLGIEGVGNPDNVGGLFRVAEAFRADGVVLDPASGDPLYRKAIRTSMGAVLRLPFFRLTAWPGGLVALREDGMKIVALTPHESAVPLAEYSRSIGPEERLVLMVGAEGAGLSDRVMQLSDARVRIPIANGVDSLNVVVAAGIALATLPRAGAGGPQG
jgi:tRNA G18 (ribose-2'-O)-methylase SpoU